MKKWAKKNKTKTAMLLLLCPANKGIKIIESES